MNRREKDFAECLAEEFLCDLAGDFFGRRRRLEAMIQGFEEAMAALKCQQAAVLGRAAFLNRLWGDASTASAFFRRIGVPPEPFTAVSEVVDSVPMLRLPSSLTVRGRFTRLVREAYGVLYDAVDRYMNGPPESESACSREASPAVYFGLVMKMGELINADIRAATGAPGRTLGYVRQSGLLDLETTGPLSSPAGDYEENMDRKLAISPIDLEGLERCRFPRLPAPAAAAGAIDDCCRRHWASCPEQVRRILTALRDQARHQDEIRVAGC